MAEHATHFDKTYASDIVLAGIGTGLHTDIRAYDSFVAAMTAIATTKAILRITEDTTYTASIPIVDYSNTLIVIASGKSFTINRSGTHAFSIHIEHNAQLKIDTSCTISGDIFITSDYAVPIIGVTGNEVLTITGKVSPNSLNISDSSITINGYLKKVSLDVPTIAALETLEGTYDGQSVQLAANTTSGDLDSSVFTWMATSEAVVNATTIFAVAGVPIGRWLRNYNGPIWVRWTGIFGDFADDCTNALQALFTNFRKIHFHEGNFKVTGELLIYPNTTITGMGPGEYYSGTEPSDISGTRIIQTAAYNLFTTDVNEAHRHGFIKFRDISLLGGSVETHPGLTGIRCMGSSNLNLSNVWVQFFSESGVHCTGSLYATIRDSLIKYNEERGIFLDYGTIEDAEEANSYLSLIENNIIHQNKDAGVELGVSTVRVTIRGNDFESQGNYYPTGKGYGVYLSGESNTVKIVENWFEGNKYSIVIGDDSATPSMNTCPTKTLIQSNEFWSVTSDVHIQCNVGRDNIIDTNRFLGNGKIVLGHFSDTPKITNCGDVIIEDSNGNIVKIHNDTTINEFPYPILNQPGIVSKINCVLAVENESSPAGNLPVYKITPSTAAQCQLGFPTDYWTFSNTRGTLGFWIRTDSTNYPTIWPLLSTTEYYTDSIKDIFQINNYWKWVSIGRHFPTTDILTKYLTLTIETVDTSPVYISGLTWIPEITYDSYKHINTLTTLDYSFNPSVYGLSLVETNTGISALNQLLYGYVGQRLTIIAMNNVTIVHNYSGDERIILKGGVDLDLVSGDNIELVKTSTGYWYEV